MEIRVATNDLLSVAQAAKELQTSRPTIYRHIVLGYIRAIKLGGVLFVPVSEVERVKAESENSGGKKNEKTTNGDLGNTGARGKKR